jgi:ferritin-like metal-binding protein YciE
MSMTSSDGEIKKAFQSHRKETQGHIKRLDQVFKSLGEKPAREACPGIDGLLKEKKAFAKEKPSDEILWLWLRRVRERAFC